MTTIATLGPKDSDSYFAAQQYDPSAGVSLFTRIPDIVEAVESGEADIALVPVYNTRAGEVKEYFRLMGDSSGLYWADNIVLPIHLSLGALKDTALDTIHTIIGKASVFKQCSEYLEKNFADATLMAVVDIEQGIEDCKTHKQDGFAVIESEKLVKSHGLELLAREVVSHNRTRFAVLTRTPTQATGYDATAVLTKPLKDRVGILADLLGELTLRGLNILDLQSNTDVRTQKLQIYLEFEGHRDSAVVQEAFKNIERHIIQEEDSLRVLGSFPRVDMRVKNISSFGFIGSGAMSVWFAERLQNEGYTTYLTGRSTKLTPEQMIAKVDVVAVCVPISATAATIHRYGPLLADGQALIILAGESENTIEAAMQATGPGVEVMFVHNLWGPKTMAMKDKNAAIVRTHRSGSYCSEFEAFLYKHGADIYHDSARKHDLLMGVAQKLPTAISVALAMTLKEHQLEFNDINSHATLTSLYGLLAMARTHNQNPRTYAEIMATGGEGRKIVKSFAENMQMIMAAAEQGDIEALGTIMTDNRQYIPKTFLESRMKQAQAVDEILSRPGVRSL